MGAQPSGSRVRQLWQRVADAVSWTPPTSTEIGVVAKSGLAAGLSWWIAGLVTGVPDPVLAPLTALVVVQVSVRASVRTALQRSVAVVLGVLVALAHRRRARVERLHRRRARRRVARRRRVGAAAPGRRRRGRCRSACLVVLTAVSSSPRARAGSGPWTPLIGAAVGVVVSLVLPASRLVDARQTLDRLAASLGDVLETMGAGLQQPWSTDQTEEWRRHGAHGARAPRPPGRRGGRQRSGGCPLERPRSAPHRRRSVATRTCCRASSGRRSVSRSSPGASTTTPASPARRTAPCPPWARCSVALASAVRALVRDVLGDVGRRRRRPRARRGPSRDGQRCARGAYSPGPVGARHDEAT